MLSSVISAFTLPFSVDKHYNTFGNVKHTADLRLNSIQTHCLEFQQTIFPIFRNNSKVVYRTTQNSKLFTIKIKIPSHFRQRGCRDRFARSPR